MYLVLEEDIVMITDINISPAKRAFRGEGVIKMTGFEKSIQKVFYHLMLYVSKNDFKSL